MNVGGSMFKGALLGLCLFLGAFVLIGWNERNAVRELRAIGEIDKETVPDVPSDRVIADNEGKLVHIAGLAETDELVGNALFAVEENAIRISWNSSIYQVTESESRNDDGDTEYSYRSSWVDDPVDSSKFNSRRSSNNGSRKTFPVDDRSQAEVVNFGTFTLSETLIDQIDNDEPLPLTEVPASFGSAGGFKDGQYYTGDPDNPEIGDERIEFKIVGAQVDATVIAQQRSSSFEGYLTDSGKTKEILYVGLLSKDEVIARQHTEARTLRWALRALAFVVMWTGLGSMMDPLRRVTRLIPFVGQLIDGATTIVSAAIALALTLVSVAFFWLAFRPILSGLALLIAVALIGGAATLSKRSVEQTRLARAQAVAAADTGRSPRIEGYKILHSGGDSALRDSIDGAPAPPLPPVPSRPAPPSPPSPPSPPPPPGSGFKPNPPDAWDTPSQR